jgi:hypothetical protein
MPSLAKFRDDCVAVETSWPSFGNLMGQSKGTPNVLTYV